MAKVINLNDCFPEGKNGARGPLPKQKMFLDAALDPKNSKYIAYIGGIGCLAGDTPVLTAEGTKRLTDLRLDSVISYSGDGFYADGSVPYPVGRARLYRVSHAQGQFAAAGFHLVFCADGKYRRVDELEPGHELLQSSLLPQGTIGAPSRLESPLSARRLYQRASSFLSGCSIYFRQYGQLPPETLGIAQDIVPLLIDALKYTPTPADTDALQALAQGSIRPGQLCTLLSTMDSSLHAAALLEGEEGPALTGFSEPLSARNQEFLRSQWMNEYRHLIPEPSRNLFVSEPFNLQNYTVSYVTKVEQDSQESTYWDITVPGASNYLDSSGLVHHNSGKTLIGCVTVICWAVTHGGDYLICRQFYPELRDTTMKTFFDICPPELIVEHRVAENLVKLKTATGGIATVFFRPLEDPDKMRSMNLSGFLIDEANQVSEEAFMLLQGRLRNQKGLRKGVLVSNPKGKDYIYRWFVRKDHITDPAIREQFKLVHAPSTENVHLPDGYVQTMMAAWSEERIQREIMGSFDSFEGAVYPEFRRDVHVVKPFAIPANWTRIIGIDHGYRNPAAWVWGAVDEDGRIYLYREFYEKEWLIKEICRDGKGGKPAAPKRQLDGEKITAAYIDPATGARRGADGRSDLDWYLEYLPKDLPIVKANNAVAAGIDRIKSLLKIQPDGKPRLYVFSDCVNLIDEITNYRYAELRPSQENTRNEREEVVKLNDHLCDSTRYLVMSLPETAKSKEDVYKQIKYSSIEGSLHRELEAIRKGVSNKDPFGD